jgi:ABC-type ATPase with predicted acetyltransferase domain
MHPITVRYPVRPRRRSLAAAAVIDRFGLTEGEHDIVVAENVELGLTSRDLVLFVGPSGSGKSSLLRAAGHRLDAADVNALDLPDVPLVDALAGPVPERLGLLSSCGLAEARLALRAPAELSDGQRARFRLAYSLGRPGATRNPMMIDEFAALLDRPLAKVVAYNLRRLVSRTGVGALVATTHEDLADALNPDVVVRCRGEGHVEVTRFDVKKKRPAGSASFGSRRAPAPTGRTSLGGITAATGSASSSA